MENKRKFKAVVFDYGGVIELWDGGDINANVAEAIGVPVDQFKAEYFKHNHKSNVHNLPWATMILDVVSVFDTSDEAKQKTLAIAETYQSRKTLNAELLSFFTPLRKLGYQVAIFSNAASERREQLEQNGIAKLVDDVVISGEIGFQKPHEEAFAVLFEKLGVEPEDVIFVDDRKKSLEKADQIGYTPILFQNNAQLLAALRDLGIEW